ncbi:hypothetical protein JCM11251_000108 [Rhodosporidiobolus azoricus]
MSATATSTATVSAPVSEGTLHLKPAVEQSSPRRREKYAAPSTNFLAQYPSQRYMPALGLSFDKGIQIKDILALPEGDPKKEALFEELAYAVSLHGVCFFPDQDLKPEQLGELALRLGRASGAPADGALHIHPTEELGENGLPTVATISNIAGKGGRQITFKDDRSELASMGLHTDISFEPRPARYSMLRMHTLPPCGGNTQFNSAYAHYDMLSEPMKEMLSKLKAVHSAPMFRKQSALHGFELHAGPRGAPENVGTELEALHPIIRTNDVTGFNGLFVNQTFTERIQGITFDESKFLLDYLFRLQAQAHDAMLSYRWNVNDLAIWDNAAVNHAATFDYTEARSGDRTVYVGEIPYFDAEGGKSRKVTLGQVV